MDINDLRKLIAPLMEAQLMNHFLILVGLLKYAPSDPYMIGLYENMDEIYARIRRLMALYPSVNPLHLESYDSLLFEYRLNLLLGLQGIKAEME